MSELLVLLGNLREGDSVTLYVVFPTYRLKKTWVADHWDLRDSK